MIPPKVLRLILAAATIVAVVGCGSQAPQPPASPAGDADVSQEAQAPAAPGAPAAPSATTAAHPPAPAPVPAPAAPAPQAPAPRPAGRTIDNEPAAPATAPPRPEPRTVSIPAGTQVDVEFLDAVSSAESKVGDSIRVRVTHDVMYEGLPAIPAGSVFVGSVTEVQSLNKRIGGKPKVGVDFHRVDLTSGRTAGVETSWAMAGKSETKKDAATIGGATAGGALLGRVIEDDDKSKGTLIGAVVGAAAGTAIAAKTDGKELLIPVGTTATLELAARADITLTP